MFSERQPAIAGLSWGNGEPRLALHGWLDNAATWTRLAPLLTGQVMALDLRGHGHSEHVLGGYHIWDSVSDLLGIVSELGQPVHLLGHSMGAGIACLFAGCFPEWTRSVDLIEGLGPWTELHLNARDQIRRAAMANQPQRSPRPYPSLKVAARVRSEKGVSPVAADAIYPVIERGMAPVEGGYVWRADPKLRHPSALKMTEQQVQSCLQSIDCPVRLAVADRGMLYRSPMLERRTAWIKDIQVREFAGDHHVHLDPEQVHALADWFNQVH